MRAEFLRKLGYGRHLKDIRVNTNIPLGSYVVRLFLLVKEKARTHIA